MAVTPQISEWLTTLSQRTSGASSGLTTATDRAAFQRGVRDDISNILGQLNTIYNPLVTSLHDPVSPKTLDLGLSGNVIYTDVTAVVGSSDVYWFAAEARQYTVKETIDVLLAKFTDLENSVSFIGSPVAFDDTDLWDSISIGNANLSQVVGDAFGGDYHLDGDGVANLLYSLAQHVDNIGALFSGFPGTGLTGYTNVYPALTLASSTSPFSVTSNVISNTPSSLTNDDFVVGSAALDYDADPTHASRMWFDKSKSAFRAGYANNTSWDTAQVGTYSFAAGYRTTAAGTGSVALGYGTGITGSNVEYTSIGGGYLNSIGESNYSHIGGGYTNVIFSSDGVTYRRNTIGGGSLNTIEDASLSIIGGGSANHIGNTAVVTIGNTIAGGSLNSISNSVAHDYGFIGGGASNFIDGTGTHAVIVGGYNNSISGASVEYTFIGGGQTNFIDNSPLSLVVGGESNGITDGAHSVVGGGNANAITASFYGVIGGGWDNIITGSGGFGNHAVIVGGAHHYIYAANYGAILYGENNEVTAEYGCANGHDAVARNHGELSFANGMIAVEGDAQTSIVILKITTTDDTPTVMLLGDGGSTYAMDNDSTYLIENSIVARGSDNFSTGWKQYGVMDRNATAATTALVGTVTTTVIGDDNGGAWHCPMTANTTTGGPTITVQGEIGKTINWVAAMRLTKVTG